MRSGLTFIEVVIMVVWLVCVAAIIGGGYYVVSEIRAHGLKSIVMEIWEGPQK